MAVDNQAAGRARELCDFSDAMCQYSPEIRFFSEDSSVSAVPSLPVPSDLDQDTAGLRSDRRIRNVAVLLPRTLENRS